ncbi:MAG: hypothetical protein HC861_09915 [Rhodospirillaceae bacterium]|nr:hypothetical protein [Rhodospirillaceae bacterium]
MVGAELCRDSRDAGRPRLAADQRGGTARFPARAFHPGRGRDPADRHRAGGPAARPCRAPDARPDRVGATAGLRTLFLEHAAGNEAAGALYGRFGFSRIGRRRAYYERRGGGREDAVTLRCDLAGVRIPHQGGPLE